MERIKKVIFDFAFDDFSNNRLFEYNIVKQYPGASVWPMVRDILDSKGFRCETADVFLASGEKDGYDSAYLISEMTTRYTMRILGMKDVEPLLILSGESPNVAIDFYQSLRDKTDSFRNAMLFDGCRDFVGKKTKFLRFYWPNEHNEVLFKNNWDQRKFLVMIASNKKRMIVNDSKLFPGLRKLAKSLYLRYLTATNPLFRYRDLYSERLKAIRSLHDTKRFDLFGTKWDNTRLLEKKDVPLIAALNPRPVDDKLLTLSNYKFSICFENCTFPGYITEKIFDSFFAGCIPVYLGAPDITNYIPPETFIDFRQFNGFPELEEYLANISPEDARGYLAAAEEFLKSKKYQDFTNMSFASVVIETLESEFLEIDSRKIVGTR